MRGDYLPDDLKRLWQEMDSNPAPVSPDALRRESRRLRAGVRFRNSFVVTVCCFILAVYAIFLVRSTTPLERMGAALSIAGAANVAIQFRRRPARTMPESGAIECVRFYRAELERHRDLHRGKGVASWLLFFLPGPILFNVGFAMDQPKLAPVVAAQFAVMAAIAVIIVPLNLRASRKFQRRIDALDASLQR